MAPRPPKLFLPARHTNPATRRSQRAIQRASRPKAHGVRTTGPLAMALRPLEAVLISSGGEGCGQCRHMAWKGALSLLPRPRHKASCAGQL